MRQRPPSTKPPRRDTLLDVAGLLYRRRRLIAQVTVGVAVASILIALVLPVYYRATTTFYAASPDLTNPSKVLGQGEVEVYGSGADIERLLGVATSEETVGFLIDSFDLYTVYDVDRDSERARNDVREAFRDLYDVVRTRYDAIEISVEDQQPERAAAIANAARDRVAAVVRGVTFVSQDQVADMYRRGIRSKSRRAAAIQDSFRRLTARYGIIDAEAQAEDLSTLLGRSGRAIAVDSARLARYREGPGGRAVRDSIRTLEQRLSNRRTERGEVVRQLNRFSEGAALVQSLQTEYGAIAVQLAGDQEELRQFESLSSSKAGAVMHILDRAAVPDRKSRPVRWLIVVGATLAAFLFTVLGILLADSYKDTDWSAYFGK